MLKLSSRITNFLLLTALACAFLTTAVLPDTRMGVHPTSCGGHECGKGLVTSRRCFGFELEELVTTA